jgi:hypothetical protein
MPRNDELQLDFKPKGKSGKGILCARLGDVAIHTAKVDITDPEARTKFTASVCVKCPGIDPEELAAELEAMTGESLADNGGRDKFTQSEALVELAADAEFFHDGEVAYATVDAGDHRENHAVNGKGFRLWLARRFYNAQRKAPSAQAVQDALGVLAGRAQFDGRSLPVALRIARHGDAVYLDLANERWQAVRVTADGWEVVDNPPVKFIRRNGMHPLPVPVAGGRIEELRPLLNAADDAHWRLMVSWLVGAFRPEGPYAALGINGEQGSAKSTTCRMLRRLIDPNEADLRAAPRDDRDLMIAATNARVVGFDNLSNIAPALSDSLCRLATGGGFATRALFTDDGEKLFNVSRPILFNGIEELATRPNLLERCVVVNLPPIGEDDRMSESDLWARYERVRPRVLGALLGAVVAALRNLSSVKLPRRPRMADFAEWVVAAEPALPWPAGGFMDAYAGNRDDANELAIEASAIGPAILGLMNGRDAWSGTTQELLAVLVDRHADEKTRKRPDWPTTPKAMSDKLRRLAPVLRRHGIETKVDPHRSKRGRITRLERVGKRPAPPDDPTVRVGDGGDVDSPCHSAASSEREVIEV